MELEAKEGKIHCTDYQYTKTSSYKGHACNSEQRNLYETIKMKIKEYGMENNESTHILLLETNYVRRRESHSIQHPIF